MKPHWMFALGLIAWALAVMAPNVAMAHLHDRFLTPDTGACTVHTYESFEFTANGSMPEVVPLFGADKERVWAPGWDPEFVFPAPAKDVRGMVFRVKHGDHLATWVNTEFDVQNGRVQYAYVIPGALATLITIRCRPDRKRTHVQVEYERTSLGAFANEHVSEMAKQDAKSGPEWGKQINEYLAKQK